MTYLIVTDSLIDNLESLDLDLQYKKISVQTPLTKTSGVSLVYC